MRFIDIENLPPLLPEGWEERARKATEEVRASPPEQRAATVEKHAHLWRELSSALGHLSYGKCWYCEMRQCRSDKAVDHFRPKNRVFECRDHQGYWWLAFDWQNYRYSCTLCNSRRHDKDGTSGGKHDHFPLLDEHARAFSASDDLSRESPELLDPTSALDATMLWFGDDGLAHPRCSEDRQPQFKRAQTSIDMYHLNHADIVEARKVLQREIRQLISQGNRLFDNSHSGNPEATKAHDTITKLLRDRMAAQQDLSMAARDLIRGLRDDLHSWIDGL